MKSFLRKFRNQLIFASCVFFSTAVGYAVVTIPNDFTAGTAASANQVNENFAALKSAVDTLQTQVAALQAANPLPSQSGRLAYAFVNNDASVLRSFNSSGGTNTAVVDVDPKYTVTLPGLADAGSVGGNVQVTASGQLAFCQADPDAIGLDIVVIVTCYDDVVGNSIASDFTILYLQ